MKSLVSLAALCASLSACTPETPKTRVAAEKTTPAVADQGSAPVPAVELQPLATSEEIDRALNAPVIPAMRIFAPEHDPFTVIGNIHHVGGSSVSAYLITTPEGHFLIDGILPQSPRMILDNIAALGFDIADVKYLLNSHAHIDHAGGLAALKRVSGAVMVASELDKPTLEAGRIAFGPSASMPFPPVRVDQVIEDGGQLKLADTVMTAVITPGHTEGCTSWQMDTTAANGETYRVFFHCSSSVGGQTLVPESYPGMIESYRSTFDRIRTIKADVFLAFHSGMFGLDEHYERLKAGDGLAFVDPDALQKFNDQSEAQFDTELSRQQAAFEVTRP